ncbi:VOC family protein [Halobacillus sp. ACCC02827]|uniref:VOC family protein n=1 Tax=Bacillaceae TaxID=186817 RepID=UPI0002A50C16|nr:MULTISPECIES: VOC family protein [Bacillaceae]ELK46611.1 glyoxalase/bleomycin resistance protein/dioxygenase [Halobacillus sp. BAB-2008]QHT45520.1 glyoxalase [Bacillus sp. SB49]WJE16322.1 VOC family protein [Halobacillus sp. ACCC02827]
MYEGIHHVSILITDLDRAKHFYGEVLGFQESKERPDFGFPGAWYQLGETQIHLIQHEAGQARRDTTEIDSRDAHFAVRVHNVEAFIEKMEANDVAMLNKPHNKTEWHQVFISDPDGNLIEFNR